MTDEEFQDIKVGDIVTNKLTGTGYLITEKLYNYHIYDGYSYVAIRTIQVTNNTEWDLIPN